MRSIPLLLLLSLAGCAGDDLAPETDLDDAENLAARRCATPPPSMVAWWTFDETTGPVAADTAGAVANDGTWQAGASATPGRVAGALRFDGIDDHVTVPDDNELDIRGVPAAGARVEDLTIDAWIRRDPAVAGGIRVIVDKREQTTGTLGYGFYMYGNRLGFQLADASAPGGLCGPTAASPCTNYQSTGSIPNDGRWHFVAVVVRRGGGSPMGAFYADGAAIGTFTPRLGDLNNAADFTIGERSPGLGGGGNWAGDLDEIEVFKRALSLAELNTIYAAGPAGKCKEVCDGFDNDSDGAIDEGYPDSDADGIADCVDIDDCIDPPATMTAWWPLDETTGPMSEDIIGTFADDGGWSGGPTPVAGMVDGAMRFDGIDDFIRVGTSPDIDYAMTPNAAEDFSMDAWVRLAPGDAGGGVRVILDKRASVGGSPVGYTVFLYNRNLGFQMADASGPGTTCGGSAAYPCTNWVSTTQVPNDGRWHLIAITVDRTPVGTAAPAGRFYLDGVQIGGFAPRAGDMANTSPLVIGRRNPAISGGGFFRGELDEIELFHRVLAPTEVSALWAAGSLGKCKGEDEVCDGIDNDGDSQIDEGYPDTDGDGIADCVDRETCDGLDNDGDGLIDEGYPDTDGDGIPDCLDREECDGLDNNGDGMVDEGYPDTDGDGKADCIDTEECDCIDNDGDGLIDEGPFDTDGDGVPDIDRCLYDVEIGLTADDTFRAFMDGAPIGSETDTNWQTPVIQTLSLPAGPHLLSVAASDVFGNYAGFLGYVQTPTTTLPTGFGLWGHTNAAPPAGWEGAFQGWPGDVASVPVGTCAGVLPAWNSIPGLNPLYASGAEWVWLQNCSTQWRNNWLQLRFEVCPRQPTLP